MRAILWDNDGILVDTERLYYRANADTLRMHDVELTTELFRRHYLLENRGAWHYLESRGYTEEQIRRIRDVRDSRYRELLGTEPLAIPGADETLRALQHRYRMCIVTSSKPEHFEAIHERTGMLQYVEFALTRDCYKNSKPDPEPYLAALARLQLAADQALVIEDSERGLQAASAAGIRCWVIPTELSRDGDFSKAERVLSDISEVAKLLG